MTKGTVIIRQDRCKGCGLCVDACPQHVLILSDVLNTLGYRTVALDERRASCTGCALCALVCPDVVFTVRRERTTSRRGAVVATS